MTQSPGLTVYPNPAGTQVTVSLTGETGSRTGHIRKIEVIDRMGYLRLSKQLMGRACNSEVVDVSALPSGIYTIRVYGDHGSASTSLLKQ